MTLALVLVSIGAAVLLGRVARNRWRIPLILGSSTIAVFAFQPALPIRGLDFWLPTATLAITILMWILTTPADHRPWRENWSALAIVGGIVLALGLTRFLGLQLHLTASLPPQTIKIVLTLALAALVIFLQARFLKTSGGMLTGAFIFIILVFVLLKVPFLAELASKGLRVLNHQAANLATAQDLRWLGFSYIAFRLMHTIRDRQSGRLPFVSLGEYVAYVIFFPALSAGPIDRIERFITNLRNPQELTSDDLGEASKRVVLGLFKKFVIADTLAMIALNFRNASQVSSSGWAWLLLYAYAFQLYYDFSGYTDIAIGMGRLLGIKLPENFNSPYLKPNLTQFWNNWHITLTQWFRAYFFNPVTRALRSGKKALPIPVIILFTQLATMVLIGLWHGVTLNFVIWGLWHGLGLFIHNRWSEMTRIRMAALSSRLQTVLNVGGVILTFNFIALGWVFFALPEPTSSIHFFKVLFGLA